jgi:hypothetical protein
VTCGASYPCSAALVPLPTGLAEVNLVTNPEQTHSLISVSTDFCDHPVLEALRLSSIPHKTVTRGGTRIPCEIPITLTSLDPLHPFSEPCTIILVNLRGCAVRFSRPAQIGMAVHLDGLSTAKAAARVMNCISLGEHEKLWLLGLALEEPGNVWGIETVPDDWLP